MLEESDYKAVIRSWIAQQPKGGRGQIRKIAEFLGMHAVLASQIINGPRTLSEDHAFLLCEFMNLVSHEREYFLTLVRKARASHFRLIEYYDRQLTEIQKKARTLSQNIQTDKKMDEAAFAQFYSNWYYSATRALVAIDEGTSIDKISQRLGINKEIVEKVLEFLLLNGLCIRTEKGLAIGPQITHLDVGSPLAGRHHSNWRIKAIEIFPRQNATDLFYTGPMAVSHTARQEFRQQLITLIRTFTEQVRSSEPDELACLNIDLFAY